MKKFLAIIALLSILMSVGALPAFAAQADETLPGVTYEVSEESEVEPRADVIVWRYRTYNGVLQKRRWNETKQTWYDPYWINA